MDPTYIVLLAFIPVIIFGMIMVQKFKLKLFGLDLSFSKSDTVDIVHQIVHLAKDNQKEIYDFNMQIIKNQMIYSEGALLKIEDRLRKEVPADKVLIVQHLIHEYIKDYLRENGFAGMNSGDFAQYVSSRTAELRRLYNDNIGKTSFIESHDFSTMILDIFTHASNCASYWTSKITDSVSKYEKEYDELIKKLK